MSSKVVVTFTTCNRAHIERSTRMLRKFAESDEQLVQRAVQKLYGTGCYWWKDSGLGLHYGQVTRDGNCLTGRVRVDIHPA